MSDEYRLIVDPVVALRELARPIEGLGLQLVADAPCSLSFAFPSTSAEQLARWGGNLILEQSDDGSIRLTLTGVSPRLALRAVEDHVKSRGGTLTATEL
jgi:hypothetical protein